MTVSTSEDGRTEVTAPASVNGNDGVSFTLPAARGNAGLYMIAGLAALLLLGGLASGLTGKGIPWMGLLALTVAFAVACGVMYWLTRQINRAAKSILTIGPQGIFAPRMAARPVPWSAIERICLHDIYQRGQRLGRLMSLHVDGSARFEPGGSRFMRAANRFSYGSDLLFPVQGLSGAEEEVVAAIERFKPAGMPLDKP